MFEIIIERKPNQSEIDEIIITVARVVKKMCFGMHQAYKLLKKRFFRKKVEIGC
jgi:hypothetical protein